MCVAGGGGGGGSGALIFTIILNKEALYLLKISESLKICGGRGAQAP